MSNFTFGYWHESYFITDIHHYRKELTDGEAELEKALLDSQYDDICVLKNTTCERIRFAENLKVKAKPYYRIFNKDMSYSYLFRCLSETLDAEEDYCYNELGDGREPPNLEIWQVTAEGKKIRQMETL